MALNSQLLRPGARTSAEGRVVAVDGAAVFEPPSAVGLLAVAAPRRSRFGVKVEGVDLDALARRRELGGAVDGWARLSGVWAGSSIVVDSQDARNPSSLDASARFEWREPPVAAPGGGWPVGPLNENIDYARVLEGLGSRTSDIIVGVTQFRPSRRQVVLVVASTVPNAAEEALRPHFGARLAVVRSDWTRSEVDAALETARTHAGDWHIYSANKTTNDQGQVVVRLRVLWATNAILTWINELPDGLVHAQPWLKPSPD